VISAAPIQGERGETTGAVGAIQDITELREAQARLEEADRRKSHFLAVLSHELRNPLTPVKNSLYILERAAPAGTRRGAPRTSSRDRSTSSRTWWTTCWTSRALPAGRSNCSAGASS
jgi:signal transduction histidine kinase